MKVLILFHSLGGHTEQLAREIAVGASSIIDAEYKTFDRAEPEEIRQADGLIVGSPSYFGNPTPEIAEFWKSISHLRADMQGKAGAAFSTGLHQSGGRETTILSILHSMLIFGMVVAGDPLETGGHYGLTTYGDITEQDKINARQFGERIAKIAGKLAQREQ